MTLDMTRGKPLRLLARFALPLMLSVMLQQLYSVFDSVIVGRLLGARAFAAVGMSSNLNWFPLSMASGLAQGFGVLMAQRFGAGDKGGLRRAIAESLAMSLCFGALMTAAGVLLLEGFLALINTPSELMVLCAAYLRVVWSGLALTSLYNAVSAALNARGDSRSPFLALCISTAINILLDYLFIAVFGMGVEGAAYATLISQAASLVFCALKLLTARDARPSRREMKPDKQTARELLRLGLPLLLSRAVLSTGGLAIQAAINSYGTAFIAGTAAALRYFSLLTIVCHGLEAALATFTAQNMGARQSARVLHGTRTAVRLGLSSSLMIALPVAAFAKELILLFLPDGGSEALSIGISQLRAEAAFLFTLNLLCLCRAAIQGTGNTLVPMLAGFLELALRIGAARALPLLFGREGLYYADAAAWAGAALLLCGYYRLSVKRRLQADA